MELQEEHMSHATLSRVAFPALPTNRTGQKLVVTGKDTAIVLDDILIGDIWIAGGQSNMQHPLSRVEGGPMEIVSAN